MFAALLQRISALEEQIAQRLLQVTAQHAAETAVVEFDHLVLRAGLKALLEVEKDFRVVGEASTGEEAIEKVKADKSPFEGPNKPRRVTGQVTHWAKPELVAEIAFAEFTAAAAASRSTRRRCRRSAACAR